VSPQLIIAKDEMTTFHVTNGLIILLIGFLIQSSIERGKINFWWTKTFHKPSIARSIHPTFPTKYFANIGGQISSPMLLEGKSYSNKPMGDLFCPWIPPTKLATYFYD